MSQIQITPAIAQLLCIFKEKSRGDLGVGEEGTQMFLKADLDLFYFIFFPLCLLVPTNAQRNCRSAESELRDCFVALQNEVNRDMVTACQYLFPTFSLW